MSSFWMPTSLNLGSTASPKTLLEYVSSLGEVVSMLTREEGPLLLMMIGATAMIVSSPYF